VNGSHRTRALANGSCEIAQTTEKESQAFDLLLCVEAKGLEPSNLLTARHRQAIRPNPFQSAIVCLTWDVGLCVSVAVRVRSGALLHPLLHVTMTLMGLGPANAVRRRPKAGGGLWSRHALDWGDSMTARERCRPCRLALQVMLSPLDVPKG
jgi:hypothetical protein